MALKASGLLLVCVNPEPGDFFELKRTLIALSARVKCLISTIVPKQACILGEAGMNRMVFTGNAGNDNNSNAAGGNLGLRS